MGNFQSGPAAGCRIQKGEIHIWRLEPEPGIDLARYSGLLSAGERERAARFLFPHLTRNFIADHGRLRLILGEYAGVAPESLEFALNEYGKPELANDAAALRFNLSHTQGLTVVALCLDAPVGIDVEALRPMADYLQVAQSHFSPQEIDALLETAECDREAAFFRCWTRKEAFLKAHGLGLSIPLDSFAVSLAEEAFPALLKVDWDTEERKRWSLVSLKLGEGFAGALAIPRGEWRLRFFDWQRGAQADEIAIG